MMFLRKASISKVIIKLLLLFGYFISIQSAIITMKGNIWDESILVYLFAILFLYIFKITCENKIIITYAKYSIILSFFMILFFLFGIKTNKIQGNVIISRLPIKVILAFGGFFLIIYIIIYLWNQKIKYVVTKNEAVISLIIILGVVYSFNAQGLVTAYSIYGYLFAIVLVECMLILKCKIILKDKILWIAALGFAFLNTFGNLSNIARILQLQQFNKKMMINLILTIIIWCMIWRVVLEIFMKIMKYISPILQKQQVENKKRNILIFFIIIICWMPYFLTFYPGMLSSDSISQIAQIMNIEEMSNHHPWIHTMLIKVCFILGFKVGNSMNVAVALYSIFSMIFLAVIYTYLWNWLIKQKVGLVFRLFIMAFYVLLPINAAYSITMWKDVIFAGIIIVYILFLYNVSYSMEKISMSIMIKYIILSFLVCTLRSNGLFAWLFTIPFLFHTFRNKWKKTLVMISVVFSLLLVYKIGIQSLNIQDVDFIESLSIPAQQVAYTIVENGEISTEEYKLLENIIDVDKINNAYKSNISDPIKYLVRLKGNQRYLENHKAEFLKLYISIGLKNPYTYIQAYVNQTKGYWFHKENNWICYSEGVHENNLGITRENLLCPSMAAITIKLIELNERLYHRYFSLALQIYTLVLCIIYSLKKREKILVYMPLVGIAVSLLIATPVSAEFRYVYSLFLALPLNFMFALVNNHNMNNNVR